MASTYPEVGLRSGSERSLLNGHPWVYSGAVARPPDSAGPGAIVDVIDSRQRFVGRGFYNPSSLIRVRLLSRDRNRRIDQTFFRDLIDRARQLRQTGSLLESTNAYRLVHGESDGLPGLVVDHYAGFLVVQFHTVGVECFREEILDALQAIAQPRGLFERSDVGTRRAEGMRDRPTGPLRGEEPGQLVEFQEHGVRLFADLYRGQKTGFFLDQRQNRALLQRFCQDQSVLNCFAYSSGFSAHAHKGGARRTLDVDIATSALPAARASLGASAPAAGAWDYVVADAFPFVEELAGRGPRFDVVVLDPPSLLRRRDDLKKAMGVYTKLNRNALKLVRSGGLLVTSSCSGRISQEDFFQILRRAANGAHVDVRILHFNLHPPDHPVDPAFPEGRYLKCLFARVYR